MKESSLFHSPADALVLGIFRIGFGLVMAASMIRFGILGWAKAIYTDPAFHFTYPGFDWIKPLPLEYINALIIIAIIAALAFAIGWAARYWLALFILIFTYLELIEAAAYLNHYYFVSVLGLLLLFLPVDASLVWKKEARPVPRWTILFLRYQVGVVYFFAGVAKLNPDWLIEAMPLRIWLPARAGLPFIGPFLDWEWMPWLMSWGGALFDLFIPFVLASKRLRPFGYAVALAFHIITYALFNIGTFPFVMMVAALVFFEADEWKAIGKYVPKFSISSPRQSISYKQPASLSFYIVLGLLIFQTLFPLRHFLYPGDRIWTEEGFRFSWHVMVAEKTGTVLFEVYDPESQRTWTIQPQKELTPLQEKQMSFQPDLIWQYARHLENRFQKAGYADVEVRAEAYVSVNGRSSRLLIDPELDLTIVDRYFGDWIMRYPQRSQ